MRKILTAEDFECPCCRFSNVDERIMEILNKVNVFYPIEIVKGCRCSSRTTPESPHYADDEIKCIAAHIKVKNCPLRFRVVEKLIEYGVRRIGVDHYRGYVHLDLMSKKHPALWGYNPSGQVMG